MAHIRDTWAGDRRFAEGDQPGGGRLPLLDLGGAEPGDEMRDLGADALEVLEPQPVQTHLATAFFGEFEGAVAGAEAQVSEPLHLAAQEASVAEMDAAGGAAAVRGKSAGLLTRRGPRRASSSRTC